MRRLLAALAALLVALPASAQWVRVDTNYGLTASYATSLLASDGPALYALVLDGPVGPDTPFKVLRSTDDGDSWSVVLEFDSNGAARGISFASLDGQLALQVPDGGVARVYLSDDGGTTWHQTPAPVPFSAMYGLARDGDTYIAVGFYTYFSTDGGATWEYMPTGGGLDDIVRLGSTFYAKTSIGFRYRLVAGSTTWERISDGPFSVTGLWTDGGMLWTKTTGGALASSPDGVTWTDQPTGGTGFREGLPAPTGTPWLLHSGGAEPHALTSDQGATTTDISADYPRSDNGSLCASTYALTNTAVFGNAYAGIFSSDDCIAGGASVNGVYRYAYAVAAAPAPDLDGLRLTVAPNPMRVTASVYLALDAPARVAVVVTDALGRTVARLADEARPAGEVTLALPDGLAPGVYAVVADVDGRRVARTVTVVR